jgi:methionyl-tRNA formyltransferase
VKIALLTTETLHHAYFARELNRVYPLALAVVENRGGIAPFPTVHPLEQARDEYERALWFADGKERLRDHVPVEAVADINEPRAADVLAGAELDLVIVFGTGILRRPLLETLPCPVLNLHGGDPESYRGLDNHLWAIYHRDFSALITTLHVVNPILDDGDIVLQSGLRIEPGLELHQLRQVNTQTCVDLSLAALDQFQRFGRVLSRPQRGKGRYYSFMPTALKDQCCRIFKAYTHKLAR